MITKREMVWGIGTFSFAMFGFILALFGTCVDGGELIVIAAICVLCSVLWTIIGGRIIDKKELEESERTARRERYYKIGD